MKHSALTKKKILDELSSGLFTVSEVSRQYDISANTIRSWCKSDDVKLRKVAYTKVPDHYWDLIRHKMGEMTDRKLSAWAKEKYDITIGRTVIQRKRKELGISAKGPQPKMRRERVFLKEWEPHSQLNQVIHTWGRSNELDEYIREIERNER